MNKKQKKFIIECLQVSSMIIISVLVAGWILSHFPKYGGPILMLVGFTLVVGVCLYCHYKKLGDKK